MDLAAELVDRMARDQEARIAAQAGEGEGVWQRVRAIDEENTAQLKEILAERGWPRRADVGHQAATAVWQHAQHADQDHEFQRHCLPLLTAAVASVCRPSPSTRR